MNDLYFSCIVTCFNRADTIIRAINSIIDQTYQKFEIIVIDDGSKDNSVELIKSMCIKDSRIKLLMHNNNLGQNAALNTASKEASYEYLAFLDSDDVWLSNCLDTYANLFQKNPSAGFVYAYLEGGPSWELEGDNLYPKALSQGFISSMITIAITKNALKKIDYFDERYTICQDDDLCMRLSKNYSCSLAKIAVAKIIGNGTSMTLDQTKNFKGWQFFINNYKRDIIKHCGYKVYGNHLVLLANYAYKAKKIKGMIYYYFLGNLCLRFGNEKVTDYPTNTYMYNIKYIYRAFMQKFLI